MTDSGHIEFRKMLISLCKIVIYRYEDATRIHGYAHVTEQLNRKSIRMTSSVKRREQKCGSFSMITYAKFKWNLIHSSKNGTIMTAERFIHLFHDLLLCPISQHCVSVQRPLTHSTEA